MATTNYTEEIRKYWEVPAVAHFCSLFRSVFKLVDFDIEDFEEALITDTEYAVDGGRSSLIVDVLVTLLRGCLGKRDVTLLNYNEHLYDLLQWRWFGADLGPNPLGTDRTKACFHSLPLYPKIKILHSMCEWRLERPDVEVITRDFSGDYLRVLPMGTDDNGLTYWYFYGTRLYSEEEELKLKITNSNLNGSRKRKYESLKLGSSVQMRDEPEEASNHASEKLSDQTTEDAAKEEPAPPPCWDQALLKPPERNRWHVVCDTLDDWRTVTEKYSGSRSKNEKELYRILDTDFLPAIEKLFVENEKERSRKIAELAPRRSSDRIEIKKLQKAREEKLLAAREAVERERLAKVEEEKQRKVDQENREKRAKLRGLEKEKKNLQRNRAREERTKRLEQRQMRQQLIREGKEIPPELMLSSGGMMTDAEMEDLDLEIELEHMYGQLEKLVDFLKNQPDAEPFLLPVNEEVAPDYYTVIESPMDLEAIEDNLLDRNFKCKSEFIRAVNLMLLNCLKYNGIFSPYVKTAARFERVFIKAWKRFFLPTDLEEFSERARQEELDCISLLGALDRAIKEEYARIQGTKKQVVAKEDGPNAKRRFDAKRNNSTVVRNLLQKSTLYSRPRTNSNSFSSVLNRIDRNTSSFSDLSSSTINLDSSGGERLDETMDFSSSQNINRSVVPKRPTDRFQFLNTYRRVVDKNKQNISNNIADPNRYRNIISNSELSTGVYDNNDFNRPSTSSMTSPQMYTVRYGKTGTTPYSPTVYRTISPAGISKPNTPTTVLTSPLSKSTTDNANNNALDVQETVLFGRSSSSKDSSLNNSTNFSQLPTQPVSGGQVYALQASTGTRFCKFVDPNGVPATSEMINQALPVLKDYIHQLPKGLSTVTINVASPQPTQSNAVASPSAPQNVSVATPPAPHYISVASSSAPQNNAVTATAALLPQLQPQPQSRVQQQLQQNRLSSPSSNHIQIQQRPPPSPLALQPKIATIVHNPPTSAAAVVVADQQQQPPSKEIVDARLQLPNSVVVKQRQTLQILRPKEPASVLLHNQPVMHRVQLFSQQQRQPTIVSLPRLQPAVSVANASGGTATTKPYTIVNPSGVSVYAVRPGGVVSLANRLPNSSSVITTVNTNNNLISGTIVNTLPVSTSSAPTTAIMYVRGTLVRDPITGSYVKKS